MLKLIRIAIAVTLSATIVPAGHAAAGSWIEPNLGQADQAVRAIARDGDMTLLLEAHRVRVLLPSVRSIDVEARPGETIQQRSSRLLEMVFHGADAAAESVMGAPRGGVSRYFRGQDDGAWLNGVAHYDSVRFADAYPGIDLVYRLHGGRIEYDFVADPGADLSVIDFELLGIDNISIDSEGNLVARTPGGVFTQYAPEVFRLAADGVLNPVAGRFRLDGTHVGFDVDAGVKDGIIIDPVIEFSGYLGGSGEDSGGDVAINSRGNLIVSGRTTSLDIPGAPCCLLLQGQDIYVAEIDRTTGQLLWINFIGGSGSDWSDSMVLDSQDNIVAVGYTDSPDFPAVNAFQSVFAGSEDPAGGFHWDALVFKFNDDGSQIIFSTYYGGVDWGFVSNSKLGFEWFRGVAIDANDHIHVAGQTAAPDFPVTTQFLGRACMATEDIPGPVFVSDIALVEFAPDGTRLFATCIGGSARDGGRDVVIASDGSTYVAGFGRSLDLPTSVDAFQPTRPGSELFFYAAFVIKLNAGRTDIEWGTYVGGSDQELLQEIAVAADGTVYGVGSTSSSDFPVTANALQSSLANEPLTGLPDAFVFRLSADATTLEYGSYYGGSDFDEAYGIQIDNAGRVYFSATTSSHELALRTPLQSGPGPRFGNPTEIVPDTAITDVLHSQFNFPSGDLVFIARDGVNRYAAGFFGNQVLSDFDAATDDSRAIVAGLFASTSFGADVVFINSFAAHSIHLFDDSLPGFTPGGSFGDGSKDARDGAVVFLPSPLSMDDVVVANYGQQNEIYLDAAGTPISIGRVDGNTVAIVSGNFSGVDSNDIVAANEGQDIRLYRHIGNANYAAAVILSTANPSVSALLAGNIDTDPSTDLIIGNNPGPVQIVRFAGGLPQAIEDIPGSSGNTRSLYLGDVDNDGDADLFVGNEGPDRLYINDGLGQFTLDTQFPSTNMVTLAMDDRDGCERCMPYVASDTGLLRYDQANVDILVGVIDTVGGDLEFATYLDGGDADRTFRGLALTDSGNLLLVGRTSGSAWPVVGGAQTSPGGLDDAVFIEIDIDVDDDGVLDGSDNCLEVANPIQRDSDADAYGNFCDPDLNNDGTVNFADLQLFKQRFFGNDADADLNGDGAVNFADLQIATQYIFAPPGPSGLLLP